MGRWVHSGGVQVTLAQGLARCPDMAGLYLVLQNWMTRVAALGPGETAMCPLSWKRIGEDGGMSEYALLLVSWAYP